MLMTDTDTKLPDAGHAALIRTPCYFGGDSEGDALFGWYHQPTQSPQRRSAVLICPPIGHEYVHSHRSMRHLADHLAMQGFPTLRFDYHGSGDSGGLNQDPDRVAAWLQSVRRAISALRARSGCVDIDLIGLRLGATFAGMIAAEQDIHSLVLWEPCIQGRRFVRELKALHLTATAHTGEQLDEADDIESAGFVITQQTAQDLGKLNLKDIQPRARQILLCQRDDAVDDTSLRNTWVEQGLVVEQIKVAGYLDMMAETHFTIVPTEGIEQIASWLGAHSALDNNPNVSVFENCTEARMHYRDYAPGQNTNTPTVDITEHCLCFGEANSLFGIASQPLDDRWRKHPTIILLNSGSVHHIGPHRLYVFLSRQFAQMGFRVLRMDMAGIGDSVVTDPAAENHPYTKTATHDARAAMTALKQTQADTRFVLMGLCSGAYASFHAGLDIPDEPIVESLLINPLTFYWKEGMSLAIPSEAHYRQWNDYMSSMRKLDKWLKLLKGGVSIKEIIHTVAERVRILISVKLGELKKRLGPKQAAKDGEKDLAGDLYTLAEHVKQITFIFSENDPGYDLLTTNAKGAVNKLTKQHQLSIDFVSNADHTFSKNKARAVVIDKLTRHIAQRYMV